ncbi:MAG TPA: ATP-binding protein [Polyangiales bacterium]
MTSLDDVLITPELERRPRRVSDHAAESRALVELATVMAESPKSLFQALADSALSLCGAGSAGVSVWESGVEEVFRWRATAGEYAQYVGGTLPRHFSPCGVVVDRSAQLLMADPVRFFPYISELCAPVREVLLVPFYQEGKPVGTVWVVAHDTTRQFDAEDARLITSLTKFASAAVLTLNRMEAAERSERAKDDFIAVLAHELRNPLAPIRTGLGLLESGRDAEETQRTLAVMRRQVKHMVRLIDDLLDVSRITRGKLELRRERVTLEGVLDAAVEGSQLHLSAGLQRLRRLPLVEPLWLDADPTRLAQVIGNLLNNAHKYTPTSGEIELSARRDGEYALIEVRDTGVGIPRERLDDVFEMFSQVDPAHERAEGGLGIGLALVRKLVEMHGGLVAASSPGVGLGSTFQLRLPLSDQGPADAGAPVPARAWVPARGSRVLVVDDNDDAATLLTLALGKLGFEVSAARDGAEALAAALAERPDIVILDIGLPGMTGYEVAAQLRADPRFASTVLIALTGWGTEQDRRRALEAGFDLHLTKPVSGDDLSCALQMAAEQLAARAGRVFEQPPAVAPDAQASPPRASAVLAGA